MSDLSAQDGVPGVATRERDASLERSTETRAFSKTSEFFVGQVEFSDPMVVMSEGGQGK